MLKYKVPDMSCGHCVAAVTQAVRDVDAAAKVDVDLATRTVSIKTAAEPSRVREALEEAGYPTADV